ncbi:WXG100 family type VII secretion target [Microbacterium marinilacus]|uniref:WXG100 family type VII secretion target n=1 Tax=Microbacterium marinilacus TaxID=415209 RepID=A0ABP7BHK1_9MICO|nr:hypothetical protein [Microbacterium marinilacus]MBY0689520.1 hypothetical protein [Microbacterium marinilacus]
MSDLIAFGPEDAFHTWEDFSTVESGTMTVLGALPFGWGDMTTAVYSFGNGDWAGGLLSGAAAVAGLASTVVDPFGTLLSSVAAFLIDYVPPLPQCLDLLAGNPALVQGIGETWQNIRGALVEQVEALRAAMDSALAGWQGPAADAYERKMTLLADILQGISFAAAGIGAGFAIASVVVEVVRSITRDLIADLIGRLIAYVIETGATLGAALPIVIGQAVAAITDTVMNVTKHMDDLVKVVTQGAELTKQLGEAMGYIQTAITGIRDGLGQAQAVAP